MRAQLQMALEHWLKKSRLTQSEVAKVLRISKVRVLDLEQGKIDRFRMDFLVRLAVRAGLKPRLNWRRETRGR